MYGKFGRTQDGRDYWEGFGSEAVRMARECIAKSRARRDPARIAYWERREQEHLADPYKVMRCYLPAGMVHYERHSKGTFGPSAARMFDNP